MTDATSELERIIPPEIQNDEFHALIGKLSKERGVRHVLEIGSSAGGGSTTAFVDALRGHPDNPRLYCMEVSKPRHEALSRRYAGDAFVKCFNVSSVPLSEFPTRDEVATFYQSTPTNLNKYPLDQVQGWLDQDIVYVRDAGVPQDGIDLIKRETGIEAFDLVLIDGSEFTGSAELDHVLGANVILLDDTNAYKCYEARARLLADPDYELIADNQKLRNGYSAFRRRKSQQPAPDLPVHFFTIVLNGEPFIRYHLEAFKKLPFRWHWHIVEGVASLVHDTAWSVAGGGRIDASLHDEGRSNDGTSAYLDEIAAAHPDRITIYRKPRGVFWDGKKEMVAAPLPGITEECLLWQVDADELWTPEQIQTMRAAFIAAPGRSAAKFWCHYFVGPEALISTRHNYAQNPDQEWLRVWRFLPGDRWAAHEPPTLVRRKGGRDIDIAAIDPFLHDETEAMGAVFQHFAYVTPEQLRFKEIYYGYADADRRWRDLLAVIARGEQALLRDYFPWVTDETLVDSAANMGVTPMARLSGAEGQWRFEAAAGNLAPARAATPFPRIVFDAAFFQHNQKSGIARVWRAILQEWRASGFSAHVTVLDRAGTAPRMPGYRYRSIKAWDERASAADAFLVQRACDEEGADLFISSYYTSPIRTPSVFLAHDFIPEQMELGTSDQNLREKIQAIAHAASIICVSESTRQDLARFFPDAADKAVVIWNGVGREFAPMPAAQVEAFRAAQSLTKPYLLMVGDRRGLGGYKDGAVLFRALRRWARRDEFIVLCAGGGPLEPEFKALVAGMDVRQFDPSDEQLQIAYSGAAALIYPSRKEGFGLPVAEAMACDCPIVAADTPALQEIGGDVPFYFRAGDGADLLAALERALDPAARAAKADAATARRALFDWTASAAAYAAQLTKAATAVRDGATPRPSALWAAFRSEQKANQDEIVALIKGIPGRRAPGLLGRFAGGPLRPGLYQVRGWLLRTLPPEAVPMARKGWRAIMGIRT